MAAAAVAEVIVICGLINVATTNREDIMQFTPIEMKQIEKLRRQQRQWVWVRWLPFVIGALCFIDFALNVQLLRMIVPSSGLSSLDRFSMFGVAYIWTKCCFLFLFGLSCFTIPLVKWRGDVNQMLLLRLLDEIQQRQNS